MKKINNSTKKINVCNSTYVKQPHNITSWFSFKPDELDGIVK